MYTYRWYMVQICFLLLRTLLKRVSNDSILPLLALFTGVRVCIRSVPALIAMCRDHESLNLQQFECLLALTNLASLDNVKSRIIAEKGISCFQYLQVTHGCLVVPRSTVWASRLLC